MPLLTWNVVVAVLAGLLLIAMAAYLTYIAFWVYPFD
jgi:hypothetical protein